MKQTTAFLSPHTSVTLPDIRAQIACRGAEPGLFMVAGILEDKGALPSEMLYRIVTDASGSMRFLFSAERPEDHPDLPANNLSKALMRRIWSLQDAQTPNMQFFLRRSSHETGDISAFVGILAQNPDTPVFEDETLYDMSICGKTGAIECNVSKDDRRVDLEGCRGSTLDAFHQTPIWGWDSATFAFKSTMCPHFMQRADELIALSKRIYLEPTSALDQSDRQRFTELDADIELSSLAGSRSTIARDSQYQAYLSELNKVLPEPRAHFSGTQTRDQILEHETHVRNIIKRSR